MTRKEMLLALRAGETPLDVAIKKWEDIIAGTGEDEFRENCALCHIYKKCSGCPISEFAGCGGCCGTPYIDWAEHMIGDYHYVEMSAKSYGVFQDCDECISLSGKMLEFLKELKSKF